MHRWAFRMYPMGNLEMIILFVNVNYTQWKCKVANCTIKTHDENVIRKLLSIIQCQLRLMEIINFIHGNTLLLLNATEISFIYELNF